MTNSSSNFDDRSAFIGPSLVRCSSVVRGFDGQNISSQKPRTREVLLYLLVTLLRSHLSDSRLMVIPTVEF